MPSGFSERADVHRTSDPLVGFVCQEVMRAPRPILEIDLRK